MNNLKKLYLTKIKELGVRPNFFMSETYLSQTDIIAEIKNGWLTIRDENQYLFPAVPVRWWAKVLDNPVEEYWCGQITLAGSEFFDYNYIYNPKSFLNMTGGRWETFRKNSRKFKKYSPTYGYRIRAPHSDVVTLLNRWGKSRQQELHDYEFIYDCITNPRKGDYIRYLYDQYGRLVAINYADENHEYINYRFIIVDSNIPYAEVNPHTDEFARYLFYTDPFILSKGKHVNDGGVLASKSLEKFKDKLNPLFKFRLYNLNK